MGGCSSLNKNVVHPSRQARASRQGSIINPKGKLSQSRIISIEEKQVLNNIDGLHSEVNNALKEFMQLKGYFNSELNKILEANFIFTQFYSKLKLLKMISKNNNIQQLENIIIAVHKALQKLPKIEDNISSLKEKLRYEQIMQESSPSDQRAYVLMYKIDQSHFEEFTHELGEWDTLLRKYIDISYKEIKEKRMYSSETSFQPTSSISQSQQLYRKLNQTPTTRLSIMQSQGLLTTQNQTQSTLNQSQNCL